MDPVYFIGMVAFLVLAAFFRWGTKDNDQTAIERDLERRGCRSLYIELLPHRHGMLVRPQIGFSFPASVEAGVYRVTYENRDGDKLVAVCEMGENRSVHWTNEYREPGFDRFGNPQYLSKHGTEWRG